MGYEELGSHQPGSHDGPHGSSVRRTAGSAAGPVVDLAVDLAQPQVEPPPPPRSPRRRTALVAAAVVAGAVTLVVQNGSGSAVAPTAAPTPRADFPTALPTTAVRTPPLSTTTDLTTVVTRAQLHLTTSPTGSEVEAIRLRFDGVDLGASYGFRASDPARGDLDPGEVLAAVDDPTASDAGTGVTVFFDGVLTPRASTRLTGVLEEVAPARGWVVAQVPGTTVDISVPFAPGGGLVRRRGRRHHRPRLRRPLDRAAVLRVPRRRRPPRHQLHRAHAAEGRAGRGRSQTRSQLRPARDGGHLHPAGRLTQPSLVNPRLSCRAAWAMRCSFSMRANRT